MSASKYLKMRETEESEEEDNVSDSTDSTNLDDNDHECGDDNDDDTSSLLLRSGKQYPKTVVDNEQATSTVPSSRTLGSEDTWSIGPSQSDLDHYKTSSHKKRNKKSKCSTTVINKSVNSKILKRKKKAALLPKSPATFAHYYSANKQSKNYILFMNKILQKIFTTLSGGGFRENIYQNALCVELRSPAYKYIVSKERNTPVLYEHHEIGTVRMDIIATTPRHYKRNLDREPISFVVEMKSIAKLTDKEINQLQRYLSLMPQIAHGFLINVNADVWNIKHLANPHYVLL